MVKNDELLDDLNSEQKKAVTHRSGPLLIIAGAGTGKTTVITRRIAYIISRKWAKPSEIVALTFTDKAASEMEERVDKLVPYGFVDTQVATFHSFAANLIRDYALELKLPVNFKVLSKVEQAIFLRENIFRLGLDYYRPIANPLSHLNELLSHFSRLKDELIEPDQYVKYAQNQLRKAKGAIAKEEARKSLELSDAYKKYNELLFTNGKLDYGDLIFLSHKLLARNRHIKNECQNKYRFVLVDEFQDTNFAQYELVKLLLNRDQNITVVGDDDQSIYRFRGASISNILSFQSDFPRTTKVILNTNYRSTQQILNHSYNLIQHNNPDRLEYQNQVSKKLHSKKYGRSPELLYGQNLSSEADLVINKIIDLNKKKKIKFGDFAILARANDHLAPFMETLKYRNIPYVFVGASGLYEQEEIRSLVALMRILVNPNDNLSYFQFLTSEHVGLLPAQLVSYFAKARIKNTNLEQIFKIENPEPKIKKALSDIEQYRQKIAYRSAGEIIYNFLKDNHYFKKILHADEATAQHKINNIARFFERIHEFDRTSQNKSLISFLDNLEMILTVGDEVQSFDYDPDIDAVNVMTVHASKGLEFECVFIVNCVAERFPTRQRKDKIPLPEKFIHEKLPEGDFHLQEERRLFYVGATRAKKYLFLSAGEDYGGKRCKKLSRFILEFLNNPALIKEKRKLTGLEKIERFRPIKLARPRKSKGTLPAKLTQAQIDDYYTCPKKYYYSNVIKIPLPVNWHFMYGTAIHNAVGRYFEKKMRGKKTTLKDLICDFEKSYDNEGFITREQEEIRRHTGIETLKRFFRQAQKDDFIPDAVEKKFSFQIGGVKISGRYDLVKTQNGQTEIFDYKTSDVENQQGATRRINQSTQMVVYALSEFLANGKIPKTTLVFIESDLSASKIFKPEKLEETKKMILDVAEGIKNENYQSKPDIRTCSWCPFNGICAEAKK